jgi:anti-anti-sigma factor
MPLRVSVNKNSAECFTISPIGSIDTNTSAILEKEVNATIEQKPKVLVLDMEGVDFMSSAGVRVVLKTKKAMEAASGVLMMVNLRPQIKRVFEIINAIPSLQVFESVQELDDYLAFMQRKEIEGRNSASGAP